MKTDVELYKRYRVHEDTPYVDKIEFRFEWADDVTYKLNKGVPPYDWFSYKQGFSHSLVQKILHLIDSSPGDVVLDPFCGVGTTLLAAQEYGLNYVGFDISPLPVFVSQVKLQNNSQAKFQNNCNLAQLKEIRKEFVKKEESISTLSWPDVQIVQRGFQKQIADDLLFWKEQIMKIESCALRNLTLLCLLNTLTDVSNTRKDGGFLRLVVDKEPISVKTALLLEMDKIIESLERMSTELPLYQIDEIPKGYVEVGDARSLDLDKDTVDLTITSPPYLNKTDYTRIYSLELCLSFVSSFEELKNIRYNSVRSHVEAKYTNEISFELPEKLEQALAELKNRKLSNPKHPDMVRGYFVDMAITLKELYRVSRRGATIVFVVWNSRFSGVVFEVDTLIAAIGESMGFHLEKIFVARLTGTSIQQAKKYGDAPLRESVILLRKP